MVDELCPEVVQSKIFSLYSHEVYVYLAVASARMVLENLELIGIVALEMNILSRSEACNRFRDTVLGYQSTCAIEDYEPVRVVKLDFGEAYDVTRVASGPNPS